ncbi:MAG TPA: hypothetical protein VLN49_01380, partial [Gemmatimonadaceae bacterium]|nr:hypothetical protein [Gemmatimonadaceae bacterium]
HLIDEGWMYSLRFDHGVTSAGFALTPRAMNKLAPDGGVQPNALWRALLDRYPTISALFADARPLFPPVYRDRIQHRLARAAGTRWLLMPHAFAFVDPLFSTGIAWSLRAIERLGLLFEEAGRSRRVPALDQLERYEAVLVAEADQIDRVVAGAYEAMAHFDLFAAHAMIYFATVSYAEVRQRLTAGEGVHQAWSGFLGVGDQVLEPLARESLKHLRRITRGEANPGTTDERRAYAEWVREAIEPRNIGGFGDPARNNLYPVDIDLLIDRHALLGLTRDQVVGGAAALRGTAVQR